MKRQRVAPLGATEFASALNSSNAAGVFDVLRRFSSIVRSQRIISLRGTSTVGGLDEETEISCANELRKIKRAKKMESWKMDAQQWGNEFVGTSFAEGDLGTLEKGVWPCGLLRAYHEKSPNAAELTDGRFLPDSSFHKSLRQKGQEMLSRGIVVVYLNALLEVMLGAIQQQKVSLESVDRHSIIDTFFGLHLVLLVDLLPAAREGGDHMLASIVVTLFDHWATMRRSNSAKLLHALQTRLAVDDVKYLFSHVPTSSNSERLLCTQSVTFMSTMLSKLDGAKEPPLLESRIIERHGKFQLLDITLSVGIAHCQEWLDNFGCQRAIALFLGRLRSLIFDPSLPRRLWGYMRDLLVASFDKILDLSRCSSPRLELAADEDSSPRQALILVRSVVSNMEKSRIFAHRANKNQSEFLFAPKAVFAMAKILLMHCDNGLSPVGWLELGLSSIKKYPVILPTLFDLLNPPRLRVSSYKAVAFAGYIRYLLQKGPSPLDCLQAQHGAADPLLVFLPRRCRLHFLTAILSRDNAVVVLEVLALILTVLRRCEDFLLASTSKASSQPASELIAQVLSCLPTIHTVIALLDRPFSGRAARSVVRRMIFDLLASWSRLCCSAPPDIGVSSCFGAQSTAFARWPHYLQGKLIELLEATVGVTQAESYNSEQILEAVLQICVHTRNRRVYNRLLPLARASLLARIRGRDRRLNSCELSYEATCWVGLIEEDGVHRLAQLLSPPVASKPPASMDVARAWYDESLPGASEHIGFSCLLTATCRNGAANTSDFVRHGAAVARRMLEYQSDPILLAAFILRFGHADLPRCLLSQCGQTLKLARDSNSISKQFARKKNRDRECKNLAYLLSSIPPSELECLSRGLVKGWMGYWLPETLLACREVVPWISLALRAHSRHNFAVTAKSLLTMNQGNWIRLFESQILVSLSFPVSAVHALAGLREENLIDCCLSRSCDPSSPPVTLRQLLALACAASCEKSIQDRVVRLSTKTLSDDLRLCLSKDFLVKDVECICSFWWHVSCSLDAKSDVHRRTAEIAWKALQETLKLSGTHINSVVAFVLSKRVCDVAERCLGCLCNCFGRTDLLSCVIGILNILLGLKHGDFKLFMRDCATGLALISQLWILGGATLAVADFIRRAIVLTDSAELLAAFRSTTWQNTLDCLDSGGNTINLNGLGLIPHAIEIAGLPTVFLLQSRLISLLQLAFGNLSRRDQPDCAKKLSIAISCVYSNSDQSGCSMLQHSVAVLGINLLEHTLQRTRSSSDSRQDMYDSVSEVLECCKGFLDTWARASVSSRCHQQLVSSFAALCIEIGMDGVRESLELFRCANRALKANMEVSFANAVLTCARGHHRFDSLLSSETNAGQLSELLCVMQEASRQCGDDLSRLVGKRRLWSIFGASLLNVDGVIWGILASSPIVGDSQKSIATPLDSRERAWVVAFIEGRKIDGTLRSFPIQSSMESSSQSLFPETTGYRPVFLLSLSLTCLIRLSKQYESGNANGNQPVETHLCSFVKEFCAKGLLSLTLASLGSDEPRTRQLSLAILGFVLNILSIERHTGFAEWQRFPQVFLLLRSLQKCLAVNRVRHEAAKLPPIVALFLARATEVVMKPEHPLYVSVNRYFLRSMQDHGAFQDLCRLPIFVSLFSSSSDDSSKTIAERVWSLELLSDGCLDEGSFQLIARSHAPELLMSSVSQVQFVGQQEGGLVEKTLCVIDRFLEFGGPQAFRHLVERLGLVSWQCSVFTKDATGCPLAYGNVALRHLNVIERVILSDYFFPSFTHDETSSTLSQYGNLIVELMLNFSKGDQNMASTAGSTELVLKKAEGVLRTLGQHAVAIAPHPNKRQHHSNCGMKVSLCLRLLECTPMQDRFPLISPLCWLAMDFYSAATEIARILCIMANAISLQDGDIDRTLLTGFCSRVSFVVTTIGPNDDAEDVLLECIASWYDRLELSDDVFLQWRDCVGFLARRRGKYAGGKSFFKQPAAAATGNLH